MLSLSCQQELNIEPPSLHSPKILNVEPSSAKPGDVITITGRNFAAYHLDNFLWIGDQRFDADSGTTSRLFARIPWGASSGILSMKTTIDSVGGPTVTVLQPCSLPNGSLVCFNFSPGTSITDSSAWVLSCTGQQQKWSATISGDTISLTQFYCYGDDSGIRKTLRFKHQGNFLPPLYIDGTWWDFSFPYTYTEPIKGYITIEQWKIPGVLSGRVSTYNFYRLEWKDFNFYFVVQ